ncbi:MAG: glycoside-pentoside-hexuronide (GPH):cation symporter [Lachnospiraceae bacterium]|nr:glycoside-pentoside-hexuronide (GPH):cation symporter [Lachnospiraceae bacterium]
MDDRKLKLSTILSYGMAYGSGYQIMGALVGSYLMIFFTDTFGVPAAAAGIIMVIASIWDAINDPIMGVLADKTHTRFGKFRPYLLWVPACLTVVVVCLFMSPDLSAKGKIIWAAVFYILYGMLRTAFEIPCNALINAVTDIESERQKLISAYTQIMGIFTAVTTSFALSMVSFFGGENTSKGYMIVVGLSGIIMTVFSLCLFAATREKFVAESRDTSLPLTKQLRLLVTVKGILPTIIIWIAGYIGFNTMMGSSVYYVMYCLVRPDLISAYMMTVSLVGLLSPFILVPLFLKIFKSLKNAFIASQVLTAVCNICCLIFKGNIAAVFIFSGFGALFATMFMVYGAMLMAVVTDQSFIQTKVVMNGTIAALKGFSNKLGIALANGILSAVLAMTGYIANAVGQEPPATVTGIAFVRFGVPILMAAVAVLALLSLPAPHCRENKADK